MRVPPMQRSSASKAIESKQPKGAAAPGWVAPIMAGLTSTPMHKAPECGSWRWCSRAALSSPERLRLVESVKARHVRLSGLPDFLRSPMSVIYSDERACINTVTAVLDGVTYPLSAIASIETREIRPKAGCARWACYLIGVPLFVSVGATAVLAPPSPPDPAVINGLIGLAILGGALIIFGMLMGAGPSTYVLVLSTSAGERIALSAMDQGYVELLRRALEQALSSSGQADAATVMNFDDQLDAFWREGFLSGVNNRETLQAKYTAFINSLQAQASHLPQDEQDRLIMRLVARNAEYISLGQRDVEALKNRLGVPTSSTATNRFVQIAAETAVRATVWESVSALFRAIR
jgi:hypothetical protein